MDTDSSDVSPPRKGSLPEGSSFPHWFGTTPLVGSRGRQNSPQWGGLPSVKSTPLRGKGGDGCSSRSPISLVELGRSVVIISKNRLDEGVFKMRGFPPPRLEGARLSAPSTPSFCKASTADGLLVNRTLIVSETIDCYVLKGSLDPHEEGEDG